MYFIHSWKAEFSSTTERMMTMRTENITLYASWGRVWGSSIILSHQLYSHSIVMVYVLLTISCQFVPTKKSKIYTHFNERSISNGLQTELACIRMSLCRCCWWAGGSSVWRWWCTGNQVITGGQRAPPTACCQLCRGLQWVSFWYETKTRNILEFSMQLHSPYLLFSDVRSPGIEFVTSWTVDSTGSKSFAPVSTL